MDSELSGSNSSIFVESSEGKRVGRIEEIAQFLSLPGSLCQTVRYCAEEAEDNPTGAVFRKRKDRTE